MRLLFTALLAGGLLAALPGMAQHGYVMPRRLHNPNKQSYRRPPMRLTFGVNLATYNGDITGRLPDNTLRPGFGVGLVRPMSPHLTLVADLSYSLFKAVDQHPERGLQFEGSTGVLAGLVRYNFLQDKGMYFGSARGETKWQPFAEAGLSAILFDPKASYVSNGIVVPLTPERRNSNYTYPHLGGAIPVGGGVTYRASPYFALTLEGLYYFTSTDLLDDISERGNPNLKDKFITAAFKVEIGLRKSKGKPLVHFD